jgi:hypothetical protein
VEICVVIQGALITIQFRLILMSMEISVGSVGSGKNIKTQFQRGCSTKNMTK